MKAQQIIDLCARLQDCSGDMFYDCVTMMGWCELPEPEGGYQNGRGWKYVLEDSEEIEYPAETMNLIELMTDAGFTISTNSYKGKHGNNFCVNAIRLTEPVRTVKLESHKFKATQFTATLTEAIVELFIACMPVINKEYESNTTNEV